LRFFAADSPEHRKRGWRLGQDAPALFPRSENVMTIAAANSQDEDGVQLRVQIFLAPRPGYEDGLQQIPVTSWQDTVRREQERRRTTEKGPGLEAIARFALNEEPKPQ
jgi:hypothetical protein